MTDILQPIIGVCGPSGSGKSSSLANLPQGTVIFDFERKGFPFKHKEGHFEVIPIGEKMLSADGKMSNNAFNTFRSKFFEVINRPTAPKVIVLEGFLKLTVFVQNFALATYKNFDVYNYFAKWVGDVMEFVKNEKSIVIITGINEIAEVTETNDAGEKVLAVRNCFAIEAGQKKRTKIEQDLLLVLHLQVEIDKVKGNRHVFVTQTDGLNTAKSPAWMGLPRTVPNDLAPIVRCILENKSWGELQAKT